MNNSSTTKDSGVGWLREVPSHWQIKPLWSMFRAKKETGHPKEILLSVYRDYGVVPKASRDDNNNRESDDLGAYQLVDKDDLVTNKMKAWQGSIAISDYRGIVSPAYFVYAKHHNQNSRYIHNLLRCLPYITGYRSISKGIRVNQWDLDPDKFRLFPVLIPPREEQDQIVVYIERETIRIDELIAKKTRFIELLAEKRQALMTHAVTKGLNPRVPMKDSGIDWLGEVPAHWQIKQLRHFASVLRGKFSHRPRNDPAFYDGAFPFIQTGDITGSKKFVERYTQTLNDRGAAVSKEFPAGTLVMAIAANIGDVAILTFAAYFPDSIVGMVPKEGIDLDYMYSLLLAMKPVMLRTATINTQMNLNADKIVSLVAACPPIAEQRAIAKHLNEETGRIDALVMKTERSIELLREHRTALITAAVTGKIDLRNAA